MAVPMLWSGQKYSGLISADISWTAVTFSELKPIHGSEGAQTLAHAAELIDVKPVNVINFLRGSSFGVSALPGSTPIVFERHGDSWG